jgi:serine acetyltransferase
MMFSRLKEDIACVFERDPAAQSAFEVMTTYPGVHAVLIHRVSHYFWNAGHTMVSPLYCPYLPLADRHRNSSRAHK